MNVAQWNLLGPNHGPSGLKRYEDAIFQECSKYCDIERYQSRGNKLKTFNNFRSGDVTHITAHALGFCKTLKNAKNCVVTVHDITQHYWYNLSRQIKTWWILNELLLSQIEWFIADSEYTKIDLAHNFNIDSDSITVIPLGVDNNIFYPVNHVESRKMFNMDEDKIYALSVSSGEPWKNTELLNKLSINSEIEIIDIGYGRGKYNWLNDDRIRALYSACDMFLMPSYAEGFCLPVLEAMACGCPVISSNMTALPEVVGNAGILIHPDNIEAWNTAIDRVMQCRQKWINLGLEQVEKFTWEKCGVETWKVYEKVYLE